MKCILTYTLFIVIVFLQGCKKYEVISIPEIATIEVSNITDSSTTCGGKIISNRGSIITMKGICWDINSMPTIANNKTVDDNTGNLFTNTISGLKTNTKYYVRAYATNSKGTSYGNEVQFTTLGKIPTFSTVEITKISYLYAKTRANLLSDGGFPVLKRGICWSPNQNPTINDSITTDGVGIGIYTSSLNNLIPNKKYYCRAYATNIVGTAYSKEIQFTTLGSVPTITTVDITDISYFTAKCSSNLINNGGLTILESGVCWSNNQNPTISDFRTIESNSLGGFVSLLNDLNANTTYYARAYASNSVGIGYGNSISFTTKPLSTVQDIDGNIYNTIQIGTQIWTTENLKTTHYANGDSIPSISNNVDWKKTSSGALCYYDNLDSNAPLYGILYNWFTVEDSRNLCPTGWHVPDETEWNTLINLYGGSSVAGGKMKSTLISPLPEPRWDAPNKNATNESGFSGLPGGFRDPLGNYTTKGVNGYWWFSNAFNPDQSGYLLLQYNNAGSESNHLKKTHGLSIRCVKNL